MAVELERCGYCDGLGTDLYWCDAHQSGTCPCAKPGDCEACEGRGHFTLCRFCGAEADEQAAVCESCADNYRAVEEVA